MSDRKVILKMVLSLDGFATSPDGTHEWMFEWFGEDSTQRSLRELEDAGVHAMGRRSYEIMGPHWAASEGPVATAMNDKPKAVFSHTLKHAGWGPAEIFGGDLRAEIADLKGPGPKVDATSATWLGLLSGTIKPWLAFTRGMVIARAGLTELRWLQQVAERLQKAYAE